MWQAGPANSSPGFGGVNSKACLGLSLLVGKWNVTRPSSHLLGLWEYHALFFAVGRTSSCAAS